MFDEYLYVKLRSGIGEFVCTSTDDWEDRYIKSKGGDVTMVEIEEYGDLREEVTRIENRRR